MMATTPPMQSSNINTPHSPLHGAKYDSYSPYSNTRRSTRQSTQQRRAAVTPEPAPRSPIEPTLAAGGHDHSSTRPKKSRSVRRILHTYSPPSSTPTSPNNKRESSTVKAKSRTSTTARKISFPRSPTSPGNSSTINILSDTGDQKSLLEPATAQTMHGLPTPAKTPRKQPFPKKAAVASAARVLFPSRPDTVEEAMPKTGKGRKGRQVGFSSMMGGDGSDEAESINIFTDSRDRFPSLDRDADNPFIDHPDRHTPSSSRNQRVMRRKTNGVQTNEEIKEAFDHEEGIVYVFRGKKIFKKFPTSNTLEHEAADESNQSSPEQPNSHRHFTRSSIKPRLLFPTDAQRREREAANNNTADEEAPTDIEDPGTTTTADAEMTEQEGEVKTPVKEKFIAMPATPPSTVRKTRGRPPAQKHILDVDVEANGSGQRRAKKRNSPFDGWARRKAPANSSSSVSNALGKKREGEAMEKDTGRKVSRAEGESFSSM